MTTATRTVENELLELDREIRGDIAWMRRAQRALGSKLARVRETARHSGVLALGTTTFELYCERRGLAKYEGHQLADAARACEAEPDLGRKLEEGRVSVGSAALLAKVKDLPAFQRPADDWLRKAETSTSREFRDAVNERKEEERLGEKPTPRTLFFSRKGVADLERTQDLVSRKRRGVVGASEAVEVALGEYVERHDPERRAVRAVRRKEADGRGGSSAVDDRERGAKTRRENTSRSRYVPAAEQHAIIAMFGDRCWVAGCDEREFLDFAHDRPFRLGGTNGRRNCARYCRRHHRQFDAGAWKVRQGASGPILVDRRGNRVGRLRGRVREPTG